MVYSNRPLFRDPSGFLPGSINHVDGGVTISTADGAVLSVQPDGSYQTRPAGTAGPYELAQQAGDKLIYSPDDHVFVIATVGA